MRVRGRSFIALVLVPEPPLDDWLAGLDAQMQHSPAYFAGKPVIADLSALAAMPRHVAALMAALAARGIRLVGIEGIAPETVGTDWPPLLAGGRTVADGIAAAPAPPVAAEPTSLVLAEPVRSGQSVVFPHGDVTVIGSVGSGAEVAAGGSIHVYGTLRGRAIAGMAGNAAARIFCRRLEAELLAIDGRYRTADDIAPQFHGKPAQAWLSGDSMIVASLD